MYKQTSMDYSKEQRYQENQILEHAAEILANRYVRGDAFSPPQSTNDYVSYKLTNHVREVFAMLLLDNQHRPNPIGE